MSYVERFKFAEEYISHTDNLVKSVSDPFVRKKYIGFVVTSAVTAFELAIKDIFVSFSYEQSEVFGAFIESSYRGLNGRITLKDLEKKHIIKFGDKYSGRFKEELEYKEKSFLKLKGGSIKSSYGNIITWRNIFVHQGEIAQNATYEEAVNAFKYGQEVIHVLNSVMV